MTKNSAKKKYTPAHRSPGESKTADTFPNIGAEPNIGSDRYTENQHTHKINKITAALIRNVCDSREVMLSDRKMIPVIFIVAKFKVKPEYADDWIKHSREFTIATRAEPGCLWFDWSRSVEDPNEYVLVEAFHDDADEAHVKSDHFVKAQQDLPPLLQETPKVRNVVMEGDDWHELGEMAVN